MARQLSLFEGDARAGAPHQTITAASVIPEVRDLARQLPAGVRLGTSSWHFPGWRNLVWADA